jgi:hypothetical protein
MQQNSFTAVDAQYLIRMAESAPLPNMAKAKEAAGVLERAVVYFNGVFAPPTPEVSPQLPLVPAGTMPVVDPPV